MTALLYGLLNAQRRNYSCARLLLMQTEYLLLLLLHIKKCFISNAAGGFYCEAALGNAISFLTVLTEH